MPEAGSAEINKIQPGPFKGHRRDRWVNRSLKCLEINALHACLWAEGEVSHLVQRGWEGFPEKQRRGTCRLGRLLWRRRKSVRGVGSMRGDQGESGRGILGKHQDSRAQCRQTETERRGRQRRIGKVYGLSMRHMGHHLATLPLTYLPSYSLPSPQSPDVVLQLFQQNPPDSHHLSVGICPGMKLIGGLKVYIITLLTIKQPQNVMCYNQSLIQ